MTNEKEIILKTRELQTKTLDDGREIVELKPNVAFDEDFVEECKEKGVKPKAIKFEDEENE